MINCIIWILREHGGVVFAKSINSLAQLYLKLPSLVANSAELQWNCQGKRLKLRHIVSESHIRHHKRDSSCYRIAALGTFSPLAMTSAVFLLIWCWARSVRKVLSMTKFVLTRSVLCTSKRRRVLEMTKAVRDISFLVSVPVLSEQMTVTDPRVSTAGRARMMAFCLAMLETAQAYVSVTMASRPSGIIPTAQTSAMVTESMGSSPVYKYATRKVTRAAHMMKTASHLEIWSICSSTLVFLLSTLLTRALMVPIWVKSPVAMTSPVPAPWATSVAEKHML
mmetsp:Transcript_25690/g.46523  ORF Transcript_25690/g.46523 Transcript_25690/m.46523 type:complete len:280 (-) Transcript_25690:749-1588(-)